MKYNKIGTDAGHCKTGADIGARGGGLMEEIVTRAVTNELNIYLKEEGVHIINCNTDSSNSVTSSLNYRVNQANNNGVDLFVSIHANMGGGKGCEIYTYGGTKHDVAVRVCDKLEGLGFKSNPRRGIKDGSNLAVLRKTSMKAMLVELFFMDNPTDVELYNKLGADVIGKAIAEGILGYSISDTNKTDVSKVNYTVQVGAFNLKGNAEKCLIELKSKGVSGFIKEVK